MILVVLILIGKRPNARTEALTKLIAAAAQEEARAVPFAEKTVPVTKDDLELLLDATLNPSASKISSSPYSALWFATATDGTEVDVVMVNFVINQFKLNGRCDTHLLDVLCKRNNPDVVSPLLEYCRISGNAKAAIAAIQTCSAIAPERNFPKIHRHHRVHRRFQHPAGSRGNRRGHPQEIYQPAIARRQGDRVSSHFHQGRMQVFAHPPVGMLRRCQSR
ncbi:MAG: hypothetical protein NTW21_29230 [Verrucomicrobia bacterium]|nr:hypothetical protein [Verrucomicrobiota bacterium]